MASARTDVLEMLFCEDMPKLLDELDALFSFTLMRAFDCIESSERPQVRMAITRGVIEPLQTGRAELRDAARRGRRERLLLPQRVVTLATVQYRALCRAAETGIAAGLPPVLTDPHRARDRLSAACGRSAEPLGRRLSA